MKIREVLVERISICVYCLQYIYIHSYIYTCNYIVSGDLNLSTFWVIHSLYLYILYIYCILLCMLQSWTFPANMITFVGWISKINEISCIYRSSRGSIKAVMDFDNDEGLNCLSIDGWFGYWAPELTHFRSGVWAPASEIRYTGL